MSTPSPAVTRDDGLPTRFVLSNVRIAFAHNLNTPMVNTPAPGQAATSAPKYSCVVLIPETEQAVLTQVNTILWEACNREFGQNATAVWTELQASNKLCLRSGATKAMQEGFLGNFFISAAAKELAPPKLFHKYMNQAGTGPEQLARPQNVIYSGCYVNIQLNVWVQNNKDHGRRINAEVLAVQFAADGESFGGGAQANEAMFSAVARPTGAIGAPAQAPSFAAPAPAQAPGFNPAAQGFAPPAQAPAADGFASLSAPPAQAAGFNPPF